MNTSSSGSGVRVHRVLVVDDNHDAASSLGMLLELYGHTVWIANDGVSALNLALEHLPDTVLLDIGLPKMSGYDVARAIRKAPSGGRVILIALTGWGQSKDRQQSEDAGFDHHLVKPVDPDTILKLLSAETPKT